MFFPLGIKHTLEVITVKYVHSSSYGMTKIIVQSNEINSSKQHVDFLFSYSSRSNTLVKYHISMYGRIWIIKLWVSSPFQYLPFSFFLFLLLSFSFSLFLKYIEKLNYLTFCISNFKVKYHTEYFFNPFFEYFFLLLAVAYYSYINIAEMTQLWWIHSVGFPLCKYYKEGG